MTSPSVLEIEGLTVRVAASSGSVTLVNGVDLRVDRGEVLAIVGESGSGKSMTMLGATGLNPPGTAVDGKIRLLGQELRTLGPREVREARAKHVGFIFQDPLSSLNPLMPVGHQISEAYRRVYRKSATEAQARAVELLRKVGIPAAAQRVMDLPHQFSGGMRQRVMIAMALACEPELIIADEPTTALDVTTQAQVIALIRALQSQLGVAVIWITHDLGVVAGLADQVVVMYGGRTVESAPVDALFDRPAHPYTQALLRARPRPGQSDDALAAIPGTPPSPFDMPAGCAFYPRCPVKGDDRCRLDVPPLVQVEPRHYARTFYAVKSDQVAASC